MGKAVLESGVKGVDYMAAIIRVEGVRKAYGPVLAVDGIRFEVERGQLFAFLGPNGAGKSTTIDMISTLLRPDAGVLEVDGLQVGRDDKEIRRKIGVVFQDGLLDPLLTVRENLRVRGSFYGLRGADLEVAVDRASEVCGVTEFLDRRYGKLSGGQRRRSDIARALVNTPEILFLDEPTTGLDPQTRSNIWRTIKELRESRGMTVFLTTHYMEEAAEADYVVVIDKGRIAAEGTPASLKERYTRDRLVASTSCPGELASVLEREGWRVRVLGDQVSVELADPFEALDLVARHRERIGSFEVLKGTMDDAFIAVTGKEMRS